MRLLLAQPARRAAAILGMRREPFAQLLRILCEPSDPGGGLSRDIGLKLQRIGLPVPLQHRLRHLLQLLGALRELGRRAAPML